MFEPIRAARRSFRGCRFILHQQLTSARNRLGGGSSAVLAGLRFQRSEHELKLNLMVSADCEPTSASRIRRSCESSTADRHYSKLNGTVFGMHYWSECLRGQAATYRKLAEQTDDPVVKKNSLELASVCEEVADNIEDHLAGG
jgi:hypothetical protein